MLLPRRFAMKVIKKDGSIESFNPTKIIEAIGKATRRCMTSISTDKLNNIVEVIEEVAGKLDAISIAQIQHLVVKELYKLDETVASAYDSYKNYKTDLSALFDEVYTEANKIRFLGDTSNANSDSSLVSTRRALTYDALNRRFYRKFFLNNEENIACKDGFIYPHDQNARLDSINCCLFNVGGVMKDGFEMGNIHYNEPKTLDVAFDVIGDIILSCASQQYGGFTVPEIDKILTPYAIKSHKLYTEKYRKAGVPNAVALADADIAKDFTQGFQGLEMKLNSVGSSRGDYPFVTFTFGLDVTPIGKLCNKSMLKVRMEGQGAIGHKRPVLFPKLVMLFDDELHNDNGVASDVFKAAIKCTSKCMYPDYISLTGDGAIADIYKKYHKPVSCMGCRSFLSPYFIKGGYEPFDANDTPIYEGRFNIGVVSINLPMIYMESTGEDFYEHLHKYLEMVRNIHIRTKDYLGNLKASMNPVGFMQGGFYGGNLGPNDKIEPVLKYATASLGITALNELNILATGKSLAEDNTFSMEVIKYINDYLTKIKHVDRIAYSVYGTPAESLCGYQLRHFVNKYGIIKGVSDKDYFSNSFHCHVTEDITPIQKQDKEYDLFHQFNGGHIQYVRIDNTDNTLAIKSIILRGMKLGYYQGVNFDACYCEDCGKSYTNGSLTCPSCNSSNITVINRVCGYLGYSNIHGKSRMNDSKMSEIKERKSM